MDGGAVVSSITIRNPDDGERKGKPDGVFGGKDANMQLPVPDTVDITNLREVARECEAPVLGFAGQEVIATVRDAWARGEAELPWVRPWGNPKHDVYTGAMRYSAEARPANIRAPAVPFGLRDQLRLLALRDHEEYRTNYWIGNRAIDELQVKLRPGGKQKFVALVGDPQSGNSKSYKGWAERLTVNIDEIESNELIRIGVSVQERGEDDGADVEGDSDAAIALRKKLSCSPEPMGVRVDHSAGDNAFYQQAKDRIVLPPKAAFDASHHYWATLFHEHIHATAHPKRLGRKEPAVFPMIGELDGNGRYAYEELVAELGAAACLRGMRGRRAEGVAQRAGRARTLHHRMGGIVAPVRRVPRSSAGRCDARCAVDARQAPRKASTSTNAQDAGTVEHPLQPRCLTTTTSPTCSGRSPTCCAAPIGRRSTSASCCR